MDFVDTSHMPPRAPESPLVLKWVAALVFRLMGWKVVGPAPVVDKVVIIAAPHSSNLDGFLMIMTAWFVRIRLDWMVKIEWAEGPLGWFIKGVGGIGIDRSRSLGAVEQMAEVFKQRDKVLLAVSPEGTRRKTDHWKTGFYRIALEAGVPILPVRMDYSKKHVDLSQPFLIPSGDIEADFEVMWSYYDPIMARYPEKFSALRLRPAAIKSANAQE